MGNGCFIPRAVTISVVRSSRSVVSFITPTLALVTGGGGGDGDKRALLRVDAGRARGVSGVSGNRGGDGRRELAAEERRMLIATSRAKEDLNGAEGDPPFAACSSRVNSRKRISGSRLPTAAAAP